MPLTLYGINVGTTPGDQSGDPGRTAFLKINANSNLIAAALEDAELKAMIIPCTSEDGLVEAGTGVVTLRMPYSFVLLDVRASLKVESSGADVTIDINESGVSVLDNALTIPAGAKTSVGHSPAPLGGYVILNDDNEITIDVDSVASGGAAAGLKVTLIGYVIWTSY